VLRVTRTLDGESGKAVINSIKVVSGMDIAESRRPQDGAFVIRCGSVKTSCRAASAGVAQGEKLSVRILNRQASAVRLTEIGLSKKQLPVVKSTLEKPCGMILISGPTSSGKTTTMYAMLNEMDRARRNVITIEDPIEAILPQASQIEVNPKADITFAKALRGILRQDPDVICVGEIRAGSGVIRLAMVRSGPFDRGARVGPAFSTAGNRATGTIMPGAIAKRSKRADKGSSPDRATEDRDTKQP